MEFLLTLVLIYGIYYFVTQAIFAGGRAVKEAVTGKTTYFGPPEVRFEDEVNKDTGLLIKKIMFRGRLPNTQPMNLAFSLSAFDITDKFQPVISLIDAASEENTSCFGLFKEIGVVDNGTSITDWVQIGLIIPDLVQPAFSGEREIDIHVRLINTNDPPNIIGGLILEEEKILLGFNKSFSHNFEEKGYEEAAKDREEAQSISLKIGIAVAMADGSLDDAEGQTLKDWIIKETSSYSEDRQKELKSSYNNALKSGFAAAEKGMLSLSDLTSRLSEIGDKKTKYDAVELCLDVMAADGAADPEELKIIDNVAQALNLDLDEVAKMREQVTLDLSVELTDEAGMEALFGIQEGWSNEEKRKQIRLEFQKWSNRLNSLPEGEEREAAQNMLDNIAVLREKYG